MQRSCWLPGARRLPCPAILATGDAGHEARPALDRRGDVTENRSDRRGERHGR
jgi:hypothetical protein